MCAWKLILVCLTLCLAVAYSVSYACKASLIANQQPPIEQTLEQQHAAWVARSLERMKTIKPGTTRADLLKVFATEGGLSTGLQRTYVYRECPYFKVDVEFKPIGRRARDANGRVTLFESDGDVIESISRPYLDWSIAD